MDRVNCAFCGLPFHVRKAEPGREYFCCLGCALASRIPTADQGLPISKPLLIGVALVFVYFNQFLFYLLAGALIKDSRLVVAERFVWLAAVFGWGFSLAAGYMMLRAASRRWSDWALMIAAAVCLAVSVWIMVRQGMYAGLSPLFGADTFLIVWLGRGLLKKWVGRRRE